MNSRDSIKLIFLFALTYFILFFLPALTNFISPEIALHEWGFTLNPSMLDYTFFLMPFIGFFFIYFLVDWANEFFESNSASTVYFPLLFVVFSFLAFFVQLIVYYGNIVALGVAQGNPNLILDVSLGFACQSAVLPVGELQVYTVCFWNTLRADTFLVFVFSGLAGWISNKVMKKVSEDSLKEKRNPKPV